jgi:hypothetical protein
VPSIIDSLEVCRAAEPQGIGTYESWSWRGRAGVTFPITLPAGWTKLKETARLAPTVEQAKAEAATKAVGVAADITEWARSQRTDVGKALDQQKVAAIQEMANRSGDVQIEQMRVKTQLALLLNDARNGNDDVQKRLLATQEAAAMWAIGCRWCESRRAILRP